MSKFKKKKGGGTPGISTASLPDIVFMLLFFFMTATTMKDSDLKIENKLPKANQTSKLYKKSYIMYVYAGKPWFTRINVHYITLFIQLRGLICLR